MSMADTTDSYKPSESEAFMNERQRDYFRRKLLGWKDAIHRESAGTLTQLQSESLREADVIEDQECGSCPALETPPAAR